MKKNQRNKAHKKKQRPSTKASRWWRMIGMLIILSAVGVVFWPSPRLSVTDNPPLVSPVEEKGNSGQERLSGRWQHTDCNYVLEIRSLASDGKSEALYFNPNPIHVDHAAWQQKNNRLMVEVALRDVNCPGSTYTLEFIEGEDQLRGTYYQAVENRSFDVDFVREQ